MCGVTIIQRYRNIAPAAFCCFSLLAACSTENTSSQPVILKTTEAPLSSPVPPAVPSVQNVGFSAQNDLFPPNPKPGHCYARVLMPATYRTESERVLVSEAGSRVEIDPAQYNWGEERVVVKEASTRLETVPAVYETVTERVLVKPEERKLIEIPAKYKTVSERILEKPAHTIWKRSKGPIDGALQTSYDQSTGEVMCLVEVPASYRTVEKRVVAVPAATRETVVPAEYKTVQKRVLKTPARTREINIPAEYKTVKVKNLVRQASERKIKIPAEYSSVEKRVKVDEEKLIWREVLCDVNLNSTLVSSIQKKLKQSGYYNSSIDGILGSMTLRAVNAYARAEGLPVGRNYIAVDTAEDLVGQI